jgi:hypothetical protein
MSEPESSGRLPNPARRVSRNWVWVFLAFALLGVAAITINWVYNAGQPLTEEKLKAARERWRQNRPANYDVKVISTKMYLSSDGTSGTTVDRIDLQVRGGRVTTFLLNGREPEPLLDREGKRLVEEERRLREEYDIDGLFNSIEAFLDMDKREGNRSLLKANFDKRDGHVTLFSRQINGKYVPRIQVELKRVD